jgi:hypothetical protein
VALFVPLLPGRNFQLKGSITSLQSLPVNFPNLFPVLLGHDINPSLCGHVSPLVWHSVNDINGKDTKSKEKKQEKGKKRFQWRENMVVS